MTRKLAKAVAIFAIALAPLISAGTAEAHGGGFGGGGFHGGGFFGGFYPGYYGGYYPGYSGYGRCYVTIYGTTYCY